MMAGTTWMMRSALCEPFWDPGAECLQGGAQHESESVELR